MAFSQQEINAIPQALSVPRFSTYLAARTTVSAALSLYHWNALASSAFLFPLHVYEICIRNAAAEAIRHAHGANWPWSAAFEQSLPNPAAPNYSPRRDLVATRHGKVQLGQVIAELNFAFWESTYTSRHQSTLWDANINASFPNLPTQTALEKKASRQFIHSATGRVRKLRNRIAHHEPIFTRDLSADYAEILAIISGRCRHVADWMHRSQSVASLLAMKP